MTDVNQENPQDLQRQIDDLQRRKTEMERESAVRTSTDQAKEVLDEIISKYDLPVEGQDSVVGAPNHHGIYLHIQPRHLGLPENDFYSWITVNFTPTHHPTKSFMIHVRPALNSLHLDNMSVPFQDLPRLFDRLVYALKDSSIQELQDRRNELKVERRRIQREMRAVEKASISKVKQTIADFYAEKQ